MLRKVLLLCFLSLYASFLCISCSNSFVDCISILSKRSGSLTMIAPHRASTKAIWEMREEIHRLISEKWMVGVIKM